MCINEMKRWGCEAVRRWRCEADQMCIWADVKMEDVRVWRCQDVKMQSWETVKMIEDDIRWQNKHMCRNSDGIWLTSRSNVCRIKQTYFCQLQNIFLNSLFHCWLQTPALLVFRLDRKTLLEQPICRRSWETNVGAQSSARHASRGSNNKSKRCWSQTEHVQNLLQTCLCPTC